MGAPIEKGQTGWIHAACGGAADEDPVVELTVRVLKVRYSRPGWVIAEVIRTAGGSDDDPRQFSAVGPLPEDAKHGDMLQAIGRWEESKYGRQFKAVSCQRQIAEGASGAATLLKALRGVGDVRAQKTIDAAGGPEAFVALVLAGNGPALQGALRAAGLSPEDAQAGAETLVRERATAESIAYLAKIGLGPAKIAAAIAVWGADAKQVVEADPYALVELPGVGFLTADQIARGMGVAIDDPRRARAGAAWALQAATQEGHTWTSVAALCGEGDCEAAQAARETGVPAEALKTGVFALAEPRIVRDAWGRGRTLDPVAEIEGERVQPAALAHAEREAARHLRRLLEGVAGKAPLPLLAEVLDGLHERQAAAVEAVAGSGVVVVTGGPGVGKTHVSRRILQVLQAAGLRVACAAPTGKAAMRFRELTGTSAKTIHRTLEWSPNEKKFKRDEHRPLDADAVVVDEASMIDVSIAARLFAAIRTGARLVLVGDVDQLPSVAPGAVLRDVIESARVPVARLTHIFRQASESSIPYVARDVNEGREPRLDGTAADVRFTGTGEGGDDCGRATVDIAARQAAAVYSIPVSRVQVLAPMKKGGAGIESLNRQLQARLCPVEGRPTIPCNGGEDMMCGAGDRVIQQRNNYDLGVMNGEVGVVVACDPDSLSDLAEVETSAKNKAKKDPESDEDPEQPQRVQIVLVVEFPSAEGPRQGGYTRTEARDLALAYAITIHKSQGSSWPVVVVVAHRSHARMLERALVYTAITRAERAVWIVGERAAVGKAARTVLGAARRTTLEERIAG